MLQNATFVTRPKLSLRITSGMAISIAKTLMNVPALQLNIIATQMLNVQINQGHLHVRATMDIVEMEQIAMILMNALAPLIGTIVTQMLLARI